MMSLDSKPCSWIFVVILVGLLSQSCAQLNDEECINVTLTDPGYFPFYGIASSYMNAKYVGSYDVNSGPLVVQNFPGITSNLMLYFSNHVDQNPRQFSYIALDTYVLDGTNNTGFYGGLYYGLPTTTWSNQAQSWLKWVPWIEDAQFMQGTAGEYIQISFNNTLADFEVFRNMEANQTLALNAGYINDGIIDDTVHIFAHAHGLQELGLSSAEFGFCNLDTDRSQIPVVSASQAGDDTSMGPASLAIDDGVDSVFENGSCSVTGDVEDPWFRLDFGAMYNVQSVYIWGVANNDTSGLDYDDLDGAQVFVSAYDRMNFNQMTECGGPLNTTEPRDLQYLWPFINYGFIHPTPNPSIGPNYRECAPDTMGRYLYIRLNTAPGETKALPICEVRAYGKPLAPPLRLRAKVYSSWRGGFIADLTIPINGEINGWHLEVVFPRQVFELEIIGCEAVVVQKMKLDLPGKQTGTKYVLRNGPDELPEMGSKVQIRFVAKVFKNIKRGPKRPIQADFYQF
ncbi:uncharacterized protein [Amphiura filiformis]|uniref:uncharacterized protein isoform X1 n=1 Tax=Amphiura filiformis TaxID=82378 RepID=UPI003B218483